MRRSRSGRPKVSSTSIPGTVAPDAGRGCVRPRKGQTPFNRPGAPPDRPGCRDRRLGRDVRPGQGRRRPLSPVRVSRGALRDRELRPRPGRLAPAAIPGAGRNGGRSVRRRVARRGLRLQTAGLERTSVSSTGFITGMYVVLTPLLALVLFRVGRRARRGSASLLATAGLALLAGRSREARWPATCSCSPGPPSTRCRSC